MLLCFILYRGWNHIIDVSKNHLYEFLSTINLNFLILSGGNPIRPSLTVLLCAIRDPKPIRNTNT